MAIFAFTSGGLTGYDYFTRLAQAFLQGKVYLSDNPPWLNELIPIGEKAFAVVYPPAPAILSMPFVAVFKDGFHQDFLSWAFGAISAVTWALLTYKKSGSKALSVFMFIFAAFGNITWYLSATGSVWYLGQVSGFMFFTLAIYESLRKKRPWLTSLYMGFAILSRIQLLLALPLIVYLSRDSLKHRLNFLVFILILSEFAMANGLYNFLRFGSFTETGYSLIPGVLDEPWYSKGIFHYSYIKDNLRAMFLSLPNFKDTFPFVTPSWGGLSILITSPLFLYIFAANYKKGENLVSLLAILMIASVILTHGGTGFTQFGYRYAVDFYPPMFLLLINSLVKTGLRWHHFVLLWFSVLVNLWGVIFINFLGFVGF